MEDVMAEGGEELAARGLIWEGRVPSRFRKRLSRKLVHVLPKGLVGGGRQPEGQSKLGL